MDPGTRPAGGQTAAERLLRGVLEQGQFLPPSDHPRLRSGTGQRQENQETVFSLPSSLHPDGNNSRTVFLL